LLQAKSILVVNVFFGSGFSVRMAHYYAVHRGRKTGIYRSWHECDKQVTGYNGGLFKKFDSESEAAAFVKHGTAAPLPPPVVPAHVATSSSKKRTAPAHSDSSSKRPKAAPSHSAPMLAATDNELLHPNALHVYTDGACRNNGSAKAAGGVGVFFGVNDPRNVSEPLDEPGIRATNNRAELTAMIRAVELTAGTPRERPVVLHTDSELLRNTVTTWLPKWKRTGWMTAKGSPVVNRDLLERLDATAVAAGRPLHVRHVPAHSGIFQNEAADRLAVAGAAKARTIRPSADKNG